MTASGVRTNAPIRRTINALSRDGMGSGDATSREYLLFLYAPPADTVLAGVYFRFQDLGHSPFLLAVCDEETQ